VALFSEGVMYDWSAVYARVVGGMSLATAPLGFATFAFCMAGGRFLGDFTVTKLGPLRVLQLSGLLLAGGVAVAMIAWAGVRRRPDGGPGMGKRWIPL
jgi:hypothetical protein